MQAEILETKSRIKMATGNGREMVGGMGGSEILNLLRSCYSRNRDHFLLQRFSARQIRS